MVMHKKLVSKRQKMVFEYLLKLKGSYNVQGSTKPMESGDYICRVVGGGIDQWCFSSSPVPDVEDADGITFAGVLDKTKKGKTAVRLGSIVEISLDGVVEWAAKPVERVQEDDDAAPAPDNLPAAKTVPGEAGKPANGGAAQPMPRVAGRG